MSTHLLAPARDGDESCVECGVTLAPGAPAAFTLPCPTGRCQAPANPTDRCVFIRKADATLCVYCGRAGGEVPPDSTDFDLTT